MLRDLPRYECLLQGSQRFPSLNPTACEVFLNLLRTGDELFAAESRFLADFEISQGRFTVLMLLHRSPGESVTPAFLADEAGVTRATMTGLVDTLEKDQFVQRDADASDRRTIRICLTKKGRKFLDKMLPDYFRHVSELIHPLSEKERKQLVSLLQKIQRRLSPEKAEAR